MTDFPLAPVWVASTVTLGKMLQPNQEFGDDLLCKYVYAGKIGTNGLLNEDSEVREMWFTPSELQRLSLREGDTLVTEGGDVGRPAFIGNDLPGVGFQNSVIRLRPKLTTHPKYLFYAMDYLYRGGHVDRVCSAVSLKHFTAEKVAVQSIPLPDFETQRRIADYLDKETGEMDAMIREFEGLVRNLQARKPMKVTEVLSQETYPAIPLGLVCRLYSGDFIPLSEVDPEHDLPVFGGNGVLGRTRTGNIDEDCLIVGRVGALCGNVHRVHAPAFITDNALIVQPKISVDLTWLEHSLRSLNLGKISQASAQPVIAASKVLRERISFPPVEKQRQIAEKLDRETAKMDALIEESTKLIENLKARNTALITEVVTGRKEV